jgi:hypothetical protein
LVHLTLVKLVSGPSTGGVLSPSASEPHCKERALLSHALSFDVMVVQPQRLEHSQSPPLWTNVGQHV